jgi:hypothetical protein
MRYPKKKFQRTCIGCYNKDTKYKLIRMVIDSSGEVTLDLKYRLPGRGIYLCPSQACLELALKKRKLPLRDKKEEFISQFLTCLNSRKWISPRLKLALLLGLISGCLLSPMIRQLSVD